MVDVLFYLMALGAVLAGVGVVLAKNPVASVVSLLGTFFCLSVVYLLAGYQFLAAIQILVYGGAVMVLFLFVVMLLNLGDPVVARSAEEPLFHHAPRALGGLAVGTCIGAAGLVAVVAGGRYLAHPAGGFAAPETGLDPLPDLAEAMFTRYSLPFEAASVLLLATAVGVLVIAKRQRRAAPRAEGAEGAAAGAELPRPAPPPDRSPAAPAPSPETRPEPEREEVLS